MSILLVTKNFYENINIGPVISVRNYINYYLKKNNVFIIDHNSSKKKIIKKNKLKIILVSNIITLIQNFFKINTIIKKAESVEFHSFFDFFLVFPIIILSFFKKKKIKIYLRGMVNDNVFVKKKIIKKIYLYLINLFLRDAIIICTSKYELNISSKYFKSRSIVIQNNIVNNKYFNIPFKKFIKKKGKLKILFYSNISWKKNFLFVYKVLKELNFSVELNIYGKCIINENVFHQMLDELKNKHSVNYYGYDEDKQHIFHNNHLLFLPTLDENFGHVIVESFLHFRPCLLSNNTPWNDNELYNAGYSISLDKKYKFKRILKHFFLMDQHQFDKVCLASKKYVLDKLKNSDY
jgi:hypothetical protein